LVPPGVYTLKLSVGDKAYTQALTVVNDPRSPARGPDLRAQYDLQTKLIAGMRAAWDGYHQVAALRAAVAADTAATLPAAVVAACTAVLGQNNRTPVAATVRPLLAPVCARS